MNLKDTKVVYGNYAYQYGQARDIDPNIILGIIYIESRANPNAIGGIGEIGLMQISPIALQDFNETFSMSIKRHHLFDPETNIDVGTGYLSMIRDKYGISETREMLRAYNAGVGNIKSDRDIAMSYAEAVMRYAEQMRSL